MLLNLSIEPGHIGGVDGIEDKRQHHGEVVRNAVHGRLIRSTDMTDHNSVALVKDCL